MTAAAPPVRPWHYATLLVECSVCGAQIGSQCVAHGRARKQFHLERYELARELAGVPIKRSTTRSE